MPASLPQRPSLVGKRSGLAMLERRREREADIRPAVVVSALGREFLTVRDSANDTSYVVANPTGKTYAPDSVVYLGSNTGHGPEFVIAGPPTGFGGSSAFAAIPYSTPLPAEPANPETPNYLAFFHNGSELAVSYYVDGDSSGAVLETYAEASTPGFPALIRTDSGAAVSDYSLCYTDGSGTLKVWDWQTDTLYSYSPSGYNLSAAVYRSGKLYWIEAESPQHGSLGAYKTWFRLRSADCDLTNLATVGSPYEWDNNANGSPGQSLDSVTVYGQAATDGGLIASILWQEGETTGYKRVRFTWAGSGALSTGDAMLLNCNSVEAASGGLVVFMPVETTTLCTIADTISANPAALWAWATGEACLDLPAAGIASVYGAGTYQANSLTVIGGSPTTSLTVNAHTTYGETPRYFYAL